MTDKVLIEMTPDELQKFVEYLWTKPYGEVHELISIARAVDQRALAKLKIQQEIFTNVSER